MPVGKKPLITVVRPLGGKSKDGRKLIDEDTYRWDGRKYIYDWTPLKKQIDLVNGRAKLYQLLIDNAPWAFQRGIDFKGGQQVETYGNAWPPNDPEAWSKYIQAMLNELVKTYGRNQVEQWRFCIGREIGTAGHWRGGTKEFFEHYKNTRNAIRSVLRKAKIGTHFLWASSKNSFGPDFVKWCRRNDTRYDFIGLSYYPFYHKINRVDLDHVYKVDFAPIKNTAAWDPDATLEIHEFALIKSLSKRGNSFDNAPRDHQEAFTVMLAKMMYEHDLFDVFRWGTGENKLAEQAFLKMEGNIYFKSSESGSPTSSGNMVDAVFAYDEARRQYNVMTYNYNADPRAKKNELVKFSITVPDPPNAKFKFRNGVYTEGSLTWTDWKPLEADSASGGEKSKLKFNLNLTPFSFQKTEIKSSKTEKQAGAKIKRILTQRKTGKQIEVELVDLKKGKLLCFKKDKRYVITVADLSDEDQEFLQTWSKQKLGQSRK